MFCESTSLIHNKTFRNKIIKNPFVWVSNETHGPLVIVSCFNFDCPYPVPRHKTLSPRDLRKGHNLNNQTLWIDRPLYVHVFKVF